ncbi:MAG: glutaredoxin family protein [Alphaproteobacteria bacterium]|jgi:glutaredoxin|nr:NrdH-redoxin [Rhodospirillaceae bacterium]MDP6021154.1 glutaredoxin family protein [Alphaproteobacteria bacterium]MDP6253276.1 glutaredoxin family protein [Alphaproteobacteria bacterium]MDP7055381.1 glutaredoxin family protein [Alphaproteobacteria bacterium]MDP7227009.1 glutaredoxin family protein [Alphaproteobacteria bacterium]|tara:strand:- start:1097 stop:1339 length:243 start_codon:yes stop_codon:yes gene_type:complete
MARKIIVYSTPLCAPCEQLKGYLRAHDVEFEAKDLMMDEEAAAFIESHNIRSSPVLQVGEQLIFGPELGPEKVDEVLGLE